VNILRAAGGPMRNSAFVLERELTIGRAAGNGVCLDEPGVAAEHCKIELSEGRAVLIDLGSAAGTFVNGIPVKRRILTTGDEIGVGSSIFVLEEGTTESAARNSVEMDEGSAASAKVLELAGEDLRHLAPDTLAAMAPAKRMARSLDALLYISRGIGALRDEESLPWQLLGMIFDVIPAARGAVLLIDEETGEAKSQAAWDRSGEPEQAVHVNQALVRRAIEEKASLLDLGNGASGSDGTILCVPMVLEGRAAGVIFLESGGAQAGFTDEDFRLLSAIAGLGVVAIENARRLERLGSENQRLRAEASLTHDMVGSSARMMEVYQFIERVAPSDSTVLIFGESGTGKELAAVALHKNSPRRNQPFVALNCAALTETLLESELFGHEKGAFTSAISQKKGFLEVAEGGTIFLDEIGELSPVLQAKLLRVLQEREFVRVGGTRTIKINVRFLAATNRDLQKAVKEGTFRGDLFHRLNVISIVLPPLRERAEDIPALAGHFAALHAKSCNRNVRGISNEALKCLTRYPWPGNIRELENAIERSVVIGSGETILAEDLPETVSEIGKDEGRDPAKYHDAVLHLKKRLILEALEQAGGSVTEAAALLGLHANYLHRLMSNMELRSSAKKQSGD
jgi:transcriptional regulator with GAF, ATPase, and Fis domain